MSTEKYKIVIAESGKNDIRNIKQYISTNFKYGQIGERFSKKIRKAILALDTLPKGYKNTGFKYRGYNVYLKSYNTYLIFYTVNDITKTVTVLRILQERMNWRYVIRHWLKVWNILYIIL